MNASGCKNCETPLAGEYCVSCGQSAHTHRYTPKHILHEVFHSVTHTDRSALVFLKNILLKPGYVAKDLIEGRRKRYFNLFTFFVLSTTVFVLSSSTTHYYEYLRETMDVRSRMTHPLMNEAYALMSNNGRILSFLMMPMYAVFTWLLFRKVRYNFAEHLVYNTIIFSVYILFYALMIEFVRIDKRWAARINEIIQFVPLIYMAVGNHQLFRNNWFLTILKTLLIRVGVIAAIWCLAVLAAALTG